MRFWGYKNIQHKILNLEFSKITYRSIIQSKIQVKGHNNIVKKSSKGAYFSKKFHVKGHNLVKNSSKGA